MHEKPCIRRQKQECQWYYVLQVHANSILFQFFVNYVLVTGLCIAITFFFFFSVSEVPGRHVMYPMRSPLWNPINIRMQSAFFFHHMNMS